jgi:hypothetical protein
MFDVGAFVAMGGIPERARRRRRRRGVHGHIV